MSEWRVAGMARNAGACLVTAILSFGPIVAHAATSPGANDARQELQEVIVTAQKRQQTLEQVPASVTSLGGDFIRGIAARDFVELENYAANTNIEVSPSSSQLLIRGLGTLNDVPGLDPSVGVVVDGVPYSYPTFLSAFFADLGRFEVLRGPQGTLFGKNTSAGLLNITTNAPDPRARLLKWDVTARSYGDRSFQPVINLPLGESLALRVAGNVEHGDHGAFYNTDLHRRESAPDQDTARARLHYDAPEGWSADFNAFYSQQRDNFNKYQLTIVSPNMAALDRTYDLQFESRLDNLVSADVPAQEKSRLLGGSLTFEGDLGQPLGLSNLSITSISGFAENTVGARDLDGDFSPVPFIRDSLVYPEPARQFTQELRVTGTAPDLFGIGGEVNLVTGLYYDNYTLKTSDNFEIEDLGAAFAYLVAADAPSTGSSGVLGSSVGYIGQIFGQLLGDLGSATGGAPLQQSAQSGLTQRTENYAYFGQFEWSLLNGWSLIGGLRLGLETRSADAFSHSTSPIIKLVAMQQDFSERLHRSEHDFSPKAGFKWQPDKHTEAYFTWAQGYKSGGFNGIPLNPQHIEYGPERTNSYEAGLKTRGRLLDGPIRLSTSIYYTELKNLQVSTFQGTNVVVVNAAAARSQGVETDLLWLLPVRGLSFFGSAGFADARYSSYPDGPVAGDSKAKSRDLTGKRLPFAPSLTASMVPSYTLHLPRSVSGTIAVDLLYQGDRYLNSEDDARELQSATLQMNTRLVLADDIDGDWSLTLAANNLTREVVLDQVIDQPLAPGNFASVRTDRGRFYTANLSVSFH